MPEFDLVEIELDEGGYDENGRYYGIDLPLWKAIGDADDIIFRAKDEVEAAEHLTMVLDYFMNNKSGKWPSKRIERHDVKDFCR